MTLRMLDSIYPANLPEGADAYLGYTDGDWPTYPALTRQFPHAHVLSMTVSPALGAMGCDREPRDLSTAQMATWIKASLAAKVWRPVCYAAVSSMQACMAALGPSVHRGSVRLLSAHYGAGQHICGPGTCGLVSADMDGTQWTDSAKGTGNSRVDESVLHDDFFGPVPAPAPMLEGDMIIIEVEKSSLPAATTWPGDFLIGAGITMLGEPALYHIPDKAALAAYIDLGIPVKTLSYAQYKAIGGK